MLLKTTLVVALGILLGPGANACLQAREQEAHAQPAAATLSPAELKALIDRRAPVHVYDANGRDSYLEGHVPAALWVDYDAVAEANLPEDEDAMLVFYCWNPQCGASHTAAEQARELGYRNVWRMPEGIVGWRAAQLPVVSGPNPRTSAVVEAPHVDQ